MPRESVRHAEDLDLDSVRHAEDLDLDRTGPIMGAGPGPYLELELGPLGLDLGPLGLDQGFSSRI